MNMEEFLETYGDHPGYLEQINNPIVIPMLRRTMPRIVSADIVGTDPATNPVESGLRRFRSYSITVNKKESDHFKDNEELFKI